MRVFFPLLYLAWTEIICTPMWIKFKKVIENRKYKCTILFRPQTFYRIGVRSADGFIADSETGNHTGG